MQRRNRRRKKSLIGKVVSVFLVLIIVAIAVVFGVKALNNHTSVAKTAKSSLKSSTVPSSVVSASSQAQSGSATPAWLNSKADNQLPILMFHYVSSKQSDLVDSNWMPTSTFEANLQALQQAGYTTVTASEAEKILTTKTKPSNKMVWLTFDDGSLTVYRDIFPLLKKYHMHATAFIITGFVDKQQPGILTWAQIKEMQASGLVDFESHTVSHLDLGTLSTSDATYQLQQSQKELNQELGQNTDIICYPAGGYNQETLQLDSSLGYKFGLLDPGRNGAVAQAASASNGLLTLPRFRMASSTGPQELMSMLASSAAYNSENTVN